MKTRDKKKSRAQHESAEEARSRSLQDVEGWLDDEHPFFQHIEEIIKDRHARRPRRVLPFEDE